MELRKKKSTQPTSNSVNRKQKPKSDAEGPKKEKKRVFSSNPLKDGREEEDVSRTVVSPGGICSDRVYIYTRARHPPIATYGVLTQESKVGERKRKLAAMATILRNKTVEGLDDENCNNSIIRPPNTVAAGWRRRRSYLRWDLTSIETRWWAWRRHKRSLSLSDALRGCRVLRWLRHEYNRRAH